LRPITNGAEVPVSMLTTVHAEAKRDAQARLEQAEAKLADAERAMTQLRDLCTDLEDVAQQMAEKVAAAQKEAQQAIGEAEHQSKLREQASAEVSRLQAALSDVQGALSTRTEQLQSLEARRQRELQQEAEQTAKAQAAAQSAAARSDWLQEQVSALKTERTTLEGKLESAFNARREARSQVGSCDPPRHSRRRGGGLHVHEKAVGASAPAAVGSLSALSRAGPRLLTPACTKDVLVPRCTLHATEWHLMRRNGTHYACSVRVSGIGLPVLSFTRALIGLLHDAPNRTVPK
jgi:hypothetical protein